MRSRNSSYPKRADRRRGLLRLLASEQAGFTIIEVVVSALMVVTIAGATGTALIATNRISGDQRFRSQAEAVAQQDQERLRGMTIAQLNGLNETRDVGPYNGVTYKVTSTGTYLSSGGSASCSSTGPGAAAYMRIKTSVDWPGNHVNNDLNGALRRPLVVSESVVTQPTGGTLITNVVDQLNAPLSGANVTALGEEFVSATTGAEGCTIMSGMPSSGYYVFASKSGYVDRNGDPDPVGGATVNSAGAAFPSPNPFKLGQAGGITANFKTLISGTTYTGQKAPSLSWFNAGMTTSKNKVIAPTGTPARTIPNAQVDSWISGQPFNLFPFPISGTDYTNNYVVWAGNCDAAKPLLDANQSKATVGPGAWVVLNDGGAPVRPRVQMPALILNFNYKNPAGVTTNNVQPAAVKLTHEGCGEAWWPEVGAGSPDPPGVLRFPGQPFAPDVDGQRISVCADYTPNGGANYYRTNSIFEPETKNDNFTAGTTPPNILIDATNSWAQGRCPG